MRVIGVVDLLRGAAVHARGGRRQQYQPVERAGQARVGGDAAALAQFYRDEYGIEDVYVADLDAIGGQFPQHEAVSAVAATGVAVWLDAGIASVGQAQQALDAGASQVVVGLETLPDFQAMAEISTLLGRQHVVFSLDLRNGRPLAMTKSPQCHSIEVLTTQALQAGVGRMIVLDLARVGSGRGVDVDALAALRSRVPGCELYAGGGIASAQQLRQLSDRGVAGALMATALIEGHIAPADLRLLISR